MRRYGVSVSVLSMDTSFTCLFKTSETRNNIDSHDSEGWSPFVQLCIHVYLQYGGCHHQQGTQKSAMLCIDQGFNSNEIYFRPILKKAPCQMRDVKWIT